MKNTWIKCPALSVTHADQRQFRKPILSSQLRYSLPLFLFVAKPTWDLASLPKNRLSLEAAKDHSLSVMSKLPIVCCCSVTQSCPILCDSMDGSTPVFPVLHRLPEFAHAYVHWVGDTIQPSHPPSPLSLPTFSLSQHQGLFQWVRSSHQVVKVLELQLQHQSFQWISRIDFL